MCIPTRLAIAAAVNLCVPVLLWPPISNGQNGYIGIYSDPAGTQACTSVPPFTSVTLYVFANAVGASGDGIRGAEFRIEISNPSGWYFSYVPPTGASHVLGNPIDVDPDPDLGGGVNISFDPCQLPIGGKVSLGTISVGNMTGTTTDLTVRRHSTPRNHNYDCASLLMCDSTFTQRCTFVPITVPECTLSVTKALTSARAFSITLNPEPPEEPTSQPFEDSIERGNSHLWISGRWIDSATLDVSFDGQDLGVAGTTFPMVATGPRQYPPDEALQRTYGGIPFVQERLGEGLSIAQAVDLMDAQSLALFDLVRWAYANDHFDQVEALLLESPLVDEVNVRTSTVEITYKGGGLRHLVGGDPSPLSQRPGPGEAAREFVKSLRSTLGGRGTKIVLVWENRGIYSYQGRRVDAALMQIRHVAQGGDLGSFPPGPFRANDPTLRTLASYSQGGADR